jgi:hypothetical protein
MIIQIKDKIDCGMVCKAISKMLSYHAKSNSLENKAIAINIVDVIDNNQMPKLECKNEKSGKNH